MRSRFQKDAEEFYDAVTKAFNVDWKLVDSSKKPQPSANGWVGPYYNHNNVIYSIEYSNDFLDIAFERLSNKSEIKYKVNVTYKGGVTNDYLKEMVCGGNSATQYIYSYASNSYQECVDKAFSFFKKMLVCSSFLMANNNNHKDISSMKIDVNGKSFDFLDLEE